jgi:hypothetical protein
MSTILELDGLKKGFKVEILVININRFILVSKNIYKNPKKKQTNVE